MKHILIELFEKALFEFYNDDFISAKTHFDKIISIDEDSAPVYWYLGRIYESQNNESAAGDMYEKYLLYGLGEYNAKDYQSALKIFNDLIVSMPLLDVLYEYRANAYKCMGLIEKARKDNKSKMSFKNDNRTRDIYLFIDTETTGLPKKWDSPMKDLYNWPRIVQIAWILSDDIGNIIYEDDYIIKPVGFKISDEASKVHKISNEIATSKGADLTHILWRLKDFSHYVDYIVAHNLNFDYNVIGAEYYRYKIKNPLLSKKKICTMESTTNYCKIVGLYGYKWPKLSELYFKLFNKEIQDAHDASVDIYATFECFWKLREQQIL